METKRLILFVVFSFSLLLLWDSWQQKQLQTELAQNNLELGQVESGDYDSSGVENPSYQFSSFVLGQHRQLNRLGSHRYHRAERLFHPTGCHHL